MQDSAPKVTKLKDDQIKGQYEYIWSYGPVKDAILLDKSRKWLKNKISLKESSRFSRYKE